MKITILWEDQRGVQVKGFGPHELLVSCVADELYCDRQTIAGIIQSIPKKGSGNVISTLKRDAGKLSKSGPVCAVLDRDKVLRLWRVGQQPSDCHTGIRQAVKADAEGNYELLLLKDNVETLVAASCQALSIAKPSGKPTPEVRDELLAKTAWGDPGYRSIVRAMVPSFDRLVCWVAKEVAMAR